MKYLFAGLYAAFCLLAAGPLHAEAAPAATPAKSGAASPLGDKYDTKLPVEISSDALEVLQHENKAIFTGNVVAVQGKIRLKSDKMIVHYKQKSDQPGANAKPEPKAAAPASGSGAAAQGSMGAITLIEVEGIVCMATPEESAKGDKGNYQVDAKLLHLTGDNVILTRDKNILRGTELVYNLETGRSVLTGSGANTGHAGSRLSPTRVRGVFVPNQDASAKGKDKAAKKPAAPAAVPAPVTVLVPAAPAPSPPATPAASGNTQVKP